MAKGSIAPVLDYVAALKHRYQGEAQLLSQAGDNALPSRLVDFLGRVLTPGRYGVGPGRVVSAHPKLPVTEPFPALIYDPVINAVLHQDDELGMFPIETVFAAVHVVPDLTREALQPILADIAALRRMAKRGKHYAGYVPIEKPNGKTLFSLREIRTEAEPRTYLVARTSDRDRPDALAKVLKDAVAEEEHARLHGVLVIDRDWFFFQPVYKKKVEFAGDSALLRFAQKLSVDLSGFDMKPVALDRYFELIA